MKDFDSMHQTREEIEAEKKKKDMNGNNDSIKGEKVCCSNKVKFLYLQG